MALRLKSMWVSRTLRSHVDQRVLKVHPEPLPLLLSQPCSGQHENLGHKTNDFGEKDEAWLEGDV